MEDIPLIQSIELAFGTAAFFLPRAASESNVAAHAKQEKEILVLMSQRKLLCLLTFLVPPIAMQGATVTPLREGWQLQSACKLQADGGSIAAAGFPVEGWLKTTVPNTVLAAQAAAGVVPDPYYGANLRQIPGAGYPIGQNFSNLPMPPDSPYHCGWWYRTEFTAPAASAPERALLAAFRGHQLSRRYLG